MKAAYLLFIVTVISILSTCKNHEDIPSKQYKSALNINELGEYNKSGNILISSIFDECGEWGGHLEKIRIYTDLSMIAHARYVVYPFKCDSSEYYSDTKFLKSNIDTTIILDSRKQQAITSYISRLIQAKMIERFPGNSGKVFSVSKPDSTLLIRVYDSSQKNDSSYNQLLSELF